MIFKNSPQMCRVRSLFVCFNGADLKELYAFFDSSAAVSNPTEAVLYVACRRSAVVEDYCRSNGLRVFRVPRGQVWRITKLASRQSRRNTRSALASAVFRSARLLSQTIESVCKCLKHYSWRGVPCHEEGCVGRHVRLVPDDVVYVGVGGEKALFISLFLMGRDQPRVTWVYGPKSVQNEFASELRVSEYRSWRRRADQGLLRLHRDRSRYIGATWYLFKLQRMGRRRSGNITRTVLVCPGRVKSDGHDSELVAHVDRFVAAMVSEGIEVFIKANPMDSDIQFWSKRYRIQSGCSNGHIATIEHRWEWFPEDPSWNAPSCAMVNDWIALLLKIDVLVAPPSTTLLEAAALGVPLVLDLGPSASRDVRNFYSSST